MAQTGFTPIQLYFSSTTTNVPLAANLASGELAINITDGKLFYKDNAAAVQVIGWKTVPTSAGGTGLTSYTAGDTLYYASGTTLTKLAIGTAYQAFQVNAGATAPSWQPSATSVLTAQGDLLYASGANTLARLAKDANATRYLSNTGTTNNPAWAQINLTNGVTGVLPVANGGTNASSASITAFNNITGYTASGATGTTSTNLVFSTSPSITTPTLVGDATLSTGNAVIGTSGKGVTTSSAIPLGFGTNGSTTQAILHTSGNLQVTGRTYTTSGSSASIANGATQTLFTLGTGDVYIVNCSFPDFSGGTTTALVWLPQSGNTSYSGAAILGQNFATFSITVSGASVQISNSVGGTVSYVWSAIKLY